jgi:signal peptidase I
MLAKPCRAPPPERAARSRMMSIGESRADRTGALWETGKVIIHALILAFLVRVFFYQPFNIPSGSMKPTLLVGDYLFVSKMSYGYSRYSLPGGINFFSGRILASTPKRGVVVVFRQPRRPDIDFIKRVVGLPGDEIRVQGGVLFINGYQVPKRRVGDFTTIDDSGQSVTLARFEEVLPTNDMNPNGVKHFTLDERANGPMDNVGPYKVQAGHYFMMGDNRDNSNDSRSSSEVGAVPFENLVGRAEIIWFSGDEFWSFFKPWTWPGSIRWSRFFKVVR